VFEGELRYNGKPAMEEVRQIKPERFGRYILLDRIAGGGMAEVYRAVLPGPEGFKRTFVIKKILPRFNKSEKFVEMFVHEARIVALLNHPNIVQVYDFGSVEGQYFLAMEYLRGHDVLAIVRRLRALKRMFPIPIAAFVAHEVASSLAYAHTLAGPDGKPLGIVHRDVSPANIMCLREGGVKLVDFGIARAAIESGIEQTDPGMFKGKLRYAAPERLRNEPFDGRSDIYALGVTTWEMLTCRHLFRGADVAELWNLILGMPIPPPSSVRTDVSASLDAIVMRMLERDPKKRYQTVRSVAEDLEEAMDKTKFKSRDLPKLLVDMFGVKRDSSQFAISRISPELLASTGDRQAQKVVELPSSAIILQKTGSAGRPRRLGAAWVWGTVLAATAIALGLLAGKGRFSAMTRTPIVVPAGRGDPPDVRSDPEPTVKKPARSRSTEPFKATPRQPVNPIADGQSVDPFKVPPRQPASPITDGRSIDPFVKAVKRGGR